MKILFIHQNCPGQYKHLARIIAADPRNQVLFITKPGKPDIPGVHKIEYVTKRNPSPQTHRYVRVFEDGVLHGQAVARVALKLRAEGFTPDIICAHVGWGEALYVKDIWPQSPLLGYFEYYYHALNSDVHFDTNGKVDIDTVCRVRTKNALHLLSLEEVDWGVSPTKWQWRQFPGQFRDKISVIHDGIDTDAAIPDPEAKLALDNGVVLHAGDEIVTYVARNLEPYRGFPYFMRTVEIIQKRRPECQIVVVGGDGISYGSAPKGGGTWREHMLREVDIDPSRIHFLGQVPYNRFLRVLQVSVAHVYLTYPFVLSWSMLEAMSAGCVVIGSDTPPVSEVIEHCRNGFLVDFFQPNDFADHVDKVLEHTDRMQDIRRNARRKIVEGYSLTNCLSKHLKLISDIARNEFPYKACVEETGKKSVHPYTRRRKKHR